MSPNIFSTLSSLPSSSLSGAAQPDVCQNAYCKWRATCAARIGMRPCGYAPDDLLARWRGKPEWVS